MASGTSRSRNRIAGRATQSRAETERGEHQALGQKLGDQPAASGAECRAHRHLPAPHFAPREQEIRQVDARNQQQRRRRAQQQGYSAVRVLPAISARERATTIATERGPRKFFRRDLQTSTLPWTAARAPG